MNNFSRTLVPDATYYISKAISPLGLEKKVFIFFSIYGHGSYLGQVTQLIYKKFHSHSPISFHMNFGCSKL